MAARDVGRSSAKMHLAWQAQYKTHLHQICLEVSKFPERACIVEHHIIRFAKMILGDKCKTSYDLASLFRGRGSTLETGDGTIAKRVGTRLPALRSAFCF